MRLDAAGPFDELVERQLEPVRRGRRRSCSSEAEEAEAAWDAAGRETAEEAYGDYQLVVDAIADRLLDLRETLRRHPRRRTPPMRTGAPSPSGAARRFRRYASLVADLEPTRQGRLRARSRGPA